MRVYGYEVNTPTRQLKMQANKESFKNAYLRIVMRVLCTNNVSLLKASKKNKNALFKYYEQSSKYRI
ncbi:hypothetical protein GCM10007906_04610 [Vibrio hyugaensis]|uniref:Transposase n=3 Tax=Vibrio TaxID=662 RepID=A0AAU9QM84_9VIBR|nr:MULTISPECIES: hypothetical protein [Vibrio]UQA50120.1 hypothetical protein ITG12_13195 [Vibrio sp. ED002]CAH1530312.1 hypothetical protein THF5H11_110020 [Vibrio jasicida]CAH1581705.1 hypothetical protein THF1C08_230073 [Vibrio jasicida]CAH1591102.1 hypothetical protein THF1A12_230071 [Vibrio jasicida]GLR02874.1 hypothetical protein GCM10007906_04610 [Vibrio hyugaensis]